MKTVNEAIEAEVVEEVEMKESLVKTYAKSFGKGMLIGTAAFLGTVVVTVAISALIGKDEEDEAIDYNYHPDAITAEFEPATVEEVE